MLKEVLATEVVRDRRAPAARTAFYRVFVDTGGGDEYWSLGGLLAAVERRRSQRREAPGIPEP